MHYCTLRASVDQRQNRGIPRGIGPRGVLKSYDCVMKVTLLADFLFDGRCSVFGLGQNCTGRQRTARRARARHARPGGLGLARVLANLEPATSTEPARCASTLRAHTRERVVSTLRDVASATNAECARGRRQARPGPRAPVLRLVAPRGPAPHATCRSDGGVQARFPRLPSPATYLVHQPAVTSQGAPPVSCRVVYRVVFTLDKLGSGMII